MPTKAEITSAYIIETVAPVFNKKGYSGTSMSDITSATGLTKGAIYGNFENKNELAVQSFVYNIKLVMSEIEQKINSKDTSIGKLYAISEFYGNYYRFTLDFGGCPILNVGIDSNHQNPQLLEKVNKAIRNIQNSIALIISDGIHKEEIKPNVDPQMYARQIFMMVEGAEFMAMTTKQAKYMTDMSNLLNQMIENDLKL